MTDAAIIQRLDRIERLITSQQQAKSAGTWVGPSWVTEATGWNKERLRQARQQNIIQFKKSKGGGYLYKIESLPAMFIKSTPHEKNNPHPVNDRPGENKTPNGTGSID